MERRVEKKLMLILIQDLATLEVILNKTLDVISKGRDKLDGFETKHALSELKN